MIRSAPSPQSNSQSAGGRSNKSRVARTATLAAVTLATSALIALSGCTSCSGDKAPAQTSGAATAAGADFAAHAKPTAPAAVAGQGTRPTAAAATAPGNGAQDAPVYRGPSSNNPAGYTITTGFSNEAGESVSQPSALETTTSFVTVLGPNSAPIGRFDTYEGAELHAFLLARDLRHAHYTHTTGAVADGADARKVDFAPREGGDHALIVVFKPVGEPAQAVSTPVVFRRALPKIAGRGVQGLSLRSRVEGGDVRLRLSPAAPRVGDPVTITAQVLDNTGALKGSERLKFLAIFNDEMGGGAVISVSSAGTSTWTPKTAGTWLVVAPPSAGKTPLTFKIVVAERAVENPAARPENSENPAAKPAKPAAKPAKPAANLAKPMKPAAASN